MSGLGKQAGEGMALLSKLGQVPPVAVELGELFAAAGFELALVGGTVRDMLLGRPSSDLDFATSAPPAETERILRRWSTMVWDIGKEFGTIGARKRITLTAAGLPDGETLLDDASMPDNAAEPVMVDVVVEITTYRSDEYDPDSRKPEVVFGKTLDGDLSRRDFTINAMAIRVPSLAFVDPFSGINDLAKKVIRTPVTPEQSFSDDPLRMMRAARFAAQLGFGIEPTTFAALCEMGARLEIVSAERIQTEFNKLMLSDNPAKGLEVLVDSELANYFLPELPALQLEIDEHHRHKDVYRHSLQVLNQAIEQETDATGPVPYPDLVLRIAAILHDAGKPATRRFEKGGGVSFHGHDVVGARIVRKRMKALKYDKATTNDVCRLIELHLRFHGYGNGEWTDSAVRRYVTDAGPLLDRLHMLTRADCTTRNLRKATQLWQSYDELEHRIAALRLQEEIDAIRPDLDGNQIMQILGIKPGRIVGEAYKHMLALRMENGPMSEAEAITELKKWYTAKTE